MKRKCVDWSVSFFYKCNTIFSANSILHKPLIILIKKMSKTITLTGFSWKFRVFVEKQEKASIYFVFEQKFVPISSGYKWKWP